MRIFRISIIILCTISTIQAQDEFSPEGVYNPNFFSELLDAEIYSSNILYIVGVGGFIFIDISDISNPSFIGRYDPNSIYIRFYNGKASANLAIGAARLDGLYFIDITSKSNPALYDVLNSGSHSYESVDFNDSLAYAAIHEAGIEVIEVKHPSTPASIRTIGGLHNAWDVFLKDDYLYVADGSAGLKIFSLVDPFNPQLVGQISTTGSAFEIIMEDQIAYVALGAAGMDVIDISSPTSPTLISNFNPGFGILNHLNYSNNKIFTANWELVFAIDVSNPYQPQVIATEDTPIRAMGIAVQNNNVYVTDWGNLKTYSFISMAQPDIHVKPTVYDFGFPGVNLFSVKEFDVYNLGETDLVINDITINNMSNYTITPTHLTIGPGDKEPVSISYSSSQPQYEINKLTFESNDPDEGQKEITLYAGRQRTVPGQPAPDFELNDLDGNAHRLSDYRGKIVLFTIFASW